MYDLITKVIEERCAYYFYGEINSACLQLLQNKENITCEGRRTTVCKAFRKRGISLKEGKLLFRLINSRKPLSILAVGSSMGLIPLCLTGYASASHCVVLEKECDLARIALRLVGKETHPSIEIRPGEYETQLVRILDKPENIDCLYLGKEVDFQMQEKIFEQCVPFFHEQSICIVAGIHASPRRKQCWQKLCRHPKATVSVDLYTLGILFFHPRLNRQTYKSMI
jgi:predicted O-methyltransferase YrrM